LKWMQHSALGIPGVYSDLPMYQKLCTNDVDGFLVAPGHWHEPLEALVQDADLRKRISIKCLQNVQKHGINKTAGNWLSAWQQILALCP